MKSKSSIAFIVELFIMFLILLMVIVVITTVSVKTRAQSLNARYLTESVILAESAAEISAQAGNAEDTADMIEKMENVSGVTVSGDTVSADISFKGEDGKTDSYKLKVRVSGDAGSSGGYITKEISVFRDGGAEAVYTLDTGNFVKE